MKSFSIRRLLVSAAFLAVLCCVFPALAANVPEGWASKKKTTTGYFGTASVLCLYGDFSDPAVTEHAEKTWAEVKEILGGLDTLLSTTIEDSEIARFNRLPSGGSMTVSSMTAELLTFACRLNEMTGGYFNPAMFPLTDLWGFSPRWIYSSAVVEPYDRQWTGGTLPLPDPAYTEAFRTLAAPGGFALTGSDAEGWTLTKTAPSVRVNGTVYDLKLDLGGVVKGYAADRVVELLQREGWKYGYFSSGSSSMQLMKSASKASIVNDDPYFTLEIRAPRGSERSYASVRVMDTALSSSGDYDNNYSVDGRLYCHIIDPFTARPLNVTEELPQRGICTVTLLSGSAAEDDALTTALLLMGPERAVAFVNDSLTGREVVMVFYSSDSEIYEVVTNVPESRLSVTAPGYVLASETDENGRIVYTGDLFRSEFMR